LGDSFSKFQRICERIFHVKKNSHFGEISPTRKKTLLWRRSGKRKDRMKLSLPPKLVEKLVWVPVVLVSKIFIPSYTFDGLLCRNWPFLPPNRQVHHFAETEFGCGLCNQYRVEIEPGTWTSLRYIQAFSKDNNQARSFRQVISFNSLSVTINAKKSFILNVVH
jgi:hypothetical protein